MRAHTETYGIELFSYHKNKLIAFHLIFLQVIWMLKHILMFIENIFSVHNFLYILYARMKANGTFLSVVQYSMIDIMCNTHIFLLIISNRNVQNKIIQNMIVKKRFQYSGLLF